MWICFLLVKMICIYVEVKCLNKKFIMGGWYEYVEVENFDYFYWNLFLKSLNLRDDGW